MKVDQVEKPVDRLSEQEKHTLFYRQISKSRDLEHDLNIYDRAEAGSETRSYKFLLLAAQRNIAKRQEGANVADSRRSHSSGDVAFPAGHKRDRDRSSSKGRSSSRKGKGRGKGKRKGKRRSSSGGSRIPPVTRTCDPGPPLVPPPPGDTHPLVGPAPRLLPVARPEADQENAQVTPEKCHVTISWQAIARETNVLTCTLVVVAEAAHHRAGQPHLLLSKRAIKERERANQGHPLLLGGHLHLW
jgi:hypothetical protein